MQKLVLWPLTCLLLLSHSLAAAQTEIIRPPLGLEYGMSYSEAKASLKSKDIKLDNLKEDKTYKTPEGFKLAKVGKYKLLDKKTDENYACFNADGELCAFQIMFRFYEGSDAALAWSKSRDFWEDHLRKALVSKYSGEGFEEHREPNQDGNVPELVPQQ